MNLKFHGSTVHLVDPCFYAMICCILLPASPPTARPHEAFWSHAGSPSDWLLPGVPPLNRAVPADGKVPIPYLCISRFDPGTSRPTASQIALTDWYALPTSPLRGPRPLPGPKNSPESYADGWRSHRWPHCPGGAPDHPPAPFSVPKSPYPPVRSLNINIQKNFCVCPLTNRIISVNSPREFFAISISRRL